ncbi:MAG TPA: SH3 domain-containing protein, partial [Anaerolineales bacterium]|nr:SH3 domain-containing protein [Anaerolineales bacterium]
MKIDFLSPPLALSLLAILTIIACGLPVSTASPAAQPTVTQNLQTEPVQTVIVQPTFTAEVGQETTIASPGPSCTVLQDLNLRSGPGTAYRPPIRVLHANDVVTPLGFAPQGIPGGSWAYVQDAATQDKGWVSAGAQ